MSALDPCETCGHAHHAHGTLSTGTGGTCLAAIPVKRSGEPPAHGEYTSGEGSVRGPFAAVCACNSCRCAACLELGAGQEALT